MNRIETCRRTEALNFRAKETSRAASALTAKLENQQVDLVKWPFLFSNRRRLGSYLDSDIHIGRYIVVDFFYCRRKAPRLSNIVTQVVQMLISCSLMVASTAFRSACKIARIWLEDASHSPRRRFKSAISFASCSKSVSRATMTFLISPTKRALLVINHFIDEGVLTPDIVSLA